MEAIKMRMDDSKVVMESGKWCLDSGKRMKKIVHDRLFAIHKQKKAFHNLKLIYKSVNLNRP